MRQGSASLSHTVAALALAGLSLAGCRGGVSRQPPVHLVLDMDFQPKLRAQAASEVYAADEWRPGPAMRLPPAGTVARGSLTPADLATYKHVAADTTVTWVTASPLPRTLELLERGRERFDINCAPCHDRTGSGQGMVARRWPVPVPTFYPKEGEDRYDLPLGRIVGAITDSFNTMPSYAHQIDWPDRWAIAEYVRALQFRMKAPK